MLKGHGYTITKENICGHELIGLKAKVAGSTDAGRMEISGKVIDESKNVIVIETKRGVKKVPKAEAEFEFALGKDRTRINGREICYRPEDRTKAYWRKTNGRV